MVRIWFGFLSKRSMLPCRLQLHLKLLQLWGYALSCRSTTADAWQLRQELGNGIHGIPGARRQPGEARPSGCEVHVGPPCSGAADATPRVGDSTNMPHTCWFIVGYVKESLVYLFIIYLHFIRNARFKSIRSFEWYLTITARPKHFWCWNIRSTFFHGNIAQLHQFTHL